MAHCREATDVAKYHISEGRVSSEFSLARKRPKMRLFL